MSTLHHLEMAALDVRDRLTKELQFSVDSERQICQALDTVDEAISHAKQQNAQALATVSEALNHLTMTVKNAFGERHRALAAALGSPGPQPETIEQAHRISDEPCEVEPPRKAPKFKITEGGAA